MYEAVFTGHLFGNGYFTKKCQQFFEEKYGFKKCLLTTSGTDALEMCAMLCDLRPDLPNCDMYADCLFRLPMYYELELEEADCVVGLIKNYYNVISK